jgi:hypothetical protein
VLYSTALFIVQAVLFAIWAVSYWGFHKEGVPLPGADFRVFWCASEVSLHHGAAAAFDPQRLLACEASLQAGTPLANMFAPWIYPPTFHLLVYPLALLSYGAAYALFMAIGMTSCFIACMPAMKRNALPWITVAAFPGIWVAMVHGQNSLLTLGLAAVALGAVESAPILAGICAGMLVIKPQLGILFPLLFLCGRHYRACAATILTAALFCTASGVLLGWSLWLRFFQSAAWFQETVLMHDDGRLWRAMPTVFAFLRTAGVDAGVAYAVHVAVALAAVIATSIAWARRTNRELLAAAAVVTTLIIQPYLVYYDLAWLLLPIILVFRHGLARRRATSATGPVYAMATLAWFAPLLSFVLICNASATHQWAAFLAPAWLIVILLRSSYERTRHTASS